MSMAFVGRCPRCFGPKEEPDTVCNYCGHDPLEDIPIAEFSKGLFSAPREYEPLPDGLSIDEKIRLIGERS